MADANYHIPFTDSNEQISVFLGNREAFRLVRKTIWQLHRVGSDGVISDPISKDQYRHDLIERIQLGLYDDYKHKEALQKSSQKISGIVTINGHIAEFDNVLEALSDAEFKRIIEDCNYQDTGGGWRSTYQELAGMVCEFVQHNGEKEVKGKHTFPEIRIQP